MQLVKYVVLKNFKNYADHNSSENSSKYENITKDNDFNSDSSDKHSTSDAVANDFMENIECLSSDLESCDEWSDDASSKRKYENCYTDSKNTASNDMPVPHETLQSMMDCPTLPAANTFFLASLPISAGFRLTKE